MVRIRRGVTLEYDDQEGKRSKWVQIPNWRCPRCTVQYKSAQLVMPRHKNSASVLTVTLVMVHQWQGRMSLLFLLLLLLFFFTYFFISSLLLWSLSALFFLIESYFIFLSFLDHLNRSRWSSGPKIFGRGRCKIGRFPYTLCAGPIVKRFTGFLPAQYFPNIQNGSQRKICVQDLVLGSEMTQ